MSSQTLRLRRLAGTFAAAAVAGAMLVGAAACSRQGAAAPATQGAGGPKPVPVRVAPAEAREVQRKVHVVGELAGYEKVAISNRVTGTVARVHVEVGARVKPGQKLLEIEQQRYLLAVKQAEQQLVETLARLGFSGLPPDDASLKLEETAPVRKAATELATAQLKYDKAKPLFEQKVMREFEFTDIANTVKVAESNLQAARDTSRALVAQARGYQTLIEVRRKDLTDTAIVAPDGRAADGRTLDSYVVTARMTSMGEYLREGTALFTLMADRTLKLQAAVPERHLAQVKLKNTVEFEVEAYPGRKFTGDIITVDPSVDVQNRTFRIEAAVDNTEGLLRPGSFVQGDILIEREAGVVVVPVRAVASFVGENKVYVIEGDGASAKARQVSVELGQQVGDWQEVLKSPRTGQVPVKAGDRIAISGVTKLVDGSSVTVSTSAPATGEAATP